MDSVTAVFEDKQVVVQGSRPGRGVRSRHGIVFLSHDAIGNQELFQLTEQAFNLGLDSVAVKVLDAAVA